MSLVRSMITIGVIFILIGIAFILVPLIIKLIPTVDIKRIPWILLYVYRRDGIFFATSPILILISIAYFLWAFANR